MRNHKSKTGRRTVRRSATKYSHYKEAPVTTGGIRVLYIIDHKSRLVRLSAIKFPHHKEAPVTTGGIQYYKRTLHKGLQVKNQKKECKGLRVKNCEGS